MCLTGAAEATYVSNRGGRSYLYLGDQTTSAINIYIIHMSSYT